jgi:hypothetical protein
MEVSIKRSINGSICNNGSLEGGIGSICNKSSLDGEIGISTSGVTEQYSGEYTVTPKIEQQVLNTKQKVMTDDLTVKGIPTYETSNDAGGTTFFIAKEN